MSIEQLDIEDRLEIYEKALSDWEQPHKKNINTVYGLCRYFRKEFNIYLYPINNVDRFKVILPELNSQRTRFEKEGVESIMHYAEDGTTKKGRSQRVKALKKAIALTKKIITQNSKEIIS